MKTLSRIILIITALISLNACTHNNGDIGHLFGTWKLDAITINGEVDSVYAKADNVLWKFQSSVMSMIRETMLLTIDLNRGLRGNIPTMKHALPSTLLTPTIITPLLELQNIHHCPKCTYPRRVLCMSISSHYLIAKWCFATLPKMAQNICIASAVGLNNLIIKQKTI